MEPPNIAATGVAAGWYPDPMHRFEFRYYNGERWTADVARQSVRYVDPIGTVPSVYSRPPTFSGPQSYARPPSRGMAVTALVFSLCSVAVAWMPFVFVLGAAGAITALILGVIVLRRAARSNNAGQPIAIGQGMAISAICVSIAALALCVVGIYLTRGLLREVDDFVNPGPYDAVIESCTRENGRGVAEGSIVNNDTQTRGYTITIAYRLDGERWQTDSVTVRDVEPGERGSFTTTSSSVDFSSAKLTCAVDTVFGPPLFSD